MKSKPQEADKHLTTSCKDCIFAEYEDDSQTGCAAGRLDLFRQEGTVIEAYDDEKEFYVIDRFCTYLRTKGWNEGYATPQAAREEVKPRVFIVVYLDNATPQSLDNTLQSILRLDCNRSHLFVAASQPRLGTTKEERHLSTHFFSMLKDEGINGRVMINIASQMREYDLFRGAGGCTHITTINIGDSIPPDALSKIDTELNEKNKRIVLFDYKKVTFLMYSVYLTRYAEYFNYTKFESAIRKEAKKAGLYMELS